MLAHNLAQEYIRRKVEKAVRLTLDTYMASFTNIIEDVCKEFNLSPEEEEWAQENLDWKVYITGGDHD